MDLDKEIGTLERRILEIKNEIMGLGEIRNGSVSEQYNVCGNPTCRCKDKDNPQKHGPDYQLSYRFNKKSTRQVVVPRILIKCASNLRTIKPL